MLPFIATLVCALSMVLSVSVEADAFLGGTSTAARPDAAVAPASSEAEDSG